MRKAIILAVTFLYAALLLGLLSCSSKESAAVKGLVEGVSSEKTVYVERIDPSYVRLIDSINLSKDGSFSYKITFNTNEPYFITLRTDSLLLGTLLLEAGESVRFTYTNGGYTVEGSEGSAQVKGLNETLASTLRKRDSLLLTITDTMTDDAVAAVNLQLARLITEQKRNNIRFIMEHPKSYASVMAIYQQYAPDYPIFYSVDDYVYFQLLTDSLQQVYPNTSYLEKLKSDTKNLRQQLELRNKLDGLTEEKDFPELELPDKYGTTQKLSSLKGKVILLYFWSSTMEGSQLDNRELLNLYEKYQPKGLEIYHVSLDTDRNRWIKAIEQQELPWVCVCDGRGISSIAANLYNVQALPYSYLIAKDGEISDKNIYGAQLEKRIAELCR